MCPPNRALAHRHLPQPTRLTNTGMSSFSKRINPFASLPMGLERKTLQLALFNDRNSTFVKSPYSSFSGIFRLALKNIKCQLAMRISPLRAHPVSLQNDQQVCPSYPRSLPGHLPGCERYCHLWAMRSESQFLSESWELDLIFFLII